MLLVACEIPVPVGPAGCHPALAGQSYADSKALANASRWVARQLVARQVVARQLVARQV